MATPAPRNRFHQKQTHKNPQVLHLRVADRIAPTETLYENIYFCQYFLKKYHTIAISYKRIHFPEKRLA